MDNRERERKHPKPGHHKREEEEQRHVHEFLGSTKLAEEEEERHNHRFAGVTGEAIPRVEVISMKSGLTLIFLITFMRS